MAVMSPFLSWALFLSVVGAVWYYQTKKNQPPTVKPLLDKSKNILLELASGTDTDSKKKKSKPKKKAASSVPKEIISTDDAASQDDDVAEEVNPAEAAKRFQASKNGGTIQPSSNRTGRQGKLAPASPFATASQTSSTGADADIDEEDATPLPNSDYPSLPKSSSADPSDMLEESSGPGVLKIVPATQTRVQPKRAKSSSTKTEAGIHATKNAKKKEKAKAEREAERKLQNEKFEQHRKAQRAAEAVQQKGKPAAPPASSAWNHSDTNGAEKPSVPTPITKAASEQPLLDTFSSEDDHATETQMMSTTLNDSVGWEDIPSRIIVEPEWNEVKRKSRKERKAPSSSGEDEPKPQSRQPSTSRVERPPLPKTQSTKTSNTFSALDTGDHFSTAASASGSDTKNQSSDDWSAVENWGVE